MKTLTDQQKLEILCAYLPHGVECLIDGAVTARMHSVYYDGTCSFHDIVESEHGFESVQPILRHPDDMTEEELKHLANNWGREFGESILADETPMYLSHAIDCLNYLHSIHIDTFDAIEAGFAVRKQLN